MKFSPTFVVSLAVSVTAAPTSSSYEVHEKREFTNPIWVPRDIKLDRRAVIPISIGLTQRNLENGHDYLMDVSDPISPNYSSHWTPEKIAEVFAPSQETIQAVKSWLIEHGISEDRLSLSRGLTWIKFNSTIGEAEDLLKMKYKVYEHSETKRPHLACDDYSVPASIKRYIDFITPTIHFDAIITEPKKRRQLPDSLGGSEKPVSPIPSTHIKDGGPISISNLGPSPNISPFNLANCNSYITPDCLRALYSFPAGTLSKSSYGIVEYTPQALHQADLNSFYANLSPNIPSGTGPTIDLIDGAVVQQTTSSFGYNGESDLDLEYAIALVYPQKVTLYQVGDIVEGGSFNTFLDALDLSYCSSGGGDNPGYDPVYPDAYSGGQKACGTITPASVISTSYGYNEADLSSAYATRQCNEYMKLGLQGITILYSSGDNGVAGNGNVCCKSKSCAGGAYVAAGVSGTFNPSFPGTCPYITSVGATQITPGNPVTAPEQACESVIYSGGGFSNVFALPSYQSSAVASYFKNHKPSYSSTQYNNTKKTRGFPDLSANGANYVTYVDGVADLVFGTSASSPVVGSIITLINEQRVNAGKKPVGFINPVLYANPGAFNDITTGTNPGCGTSGFKAVSGWDPVTGLGTPNYPKLLQVFMALP